MDFVNKFKKRHLCDLLLIDRILFQVCDRDVNVIWTQNTELFKRVQQKSCVIIDGITYECYTTSYHRIIQLLVQEQYCAVHTK